MDKLFRKLGNIYSSLLLLLVLFFVYLASSFNNFFVGDDFSWLRWAAESNTGTLLRNFWDAGGFFLRPIDKLIIYIQYSFFSLNPFPYRIFNLLLNYGASVAVYLLLIVLFKKKRIAFLGALLFSFIPSHSQDLFWIATISTTLSSAFILFGLLTHFLFRTKNSIVLFILSCLLFLCAVFSYENAVIFIGLVFLLDTFLIGKKYVTGFIKMWVSYVVYFLIIVLYLGIRSQAGAAGFSGDYNYNLIKVVPNAIGNYFGYIFLFFMSESSLSFYNLVRTNLKTYSMILSGVGVLVIVLAGGFFVVHKKKISLKENQKLFVFGLLFAGVALLPYLPLGNITLRYVYLASFGFIIMLLAVLDAILSKFSNKRVNIFIYTFILIIVGLWCYVGLQSAQRYWEKASKITYDTMISFRSKYDIKNNTNLYFYNVPIQTGEAYIFPVGLPDALYFINSDKSVKTFLVKDRVQAEQLSKSEDKSVLHSWIFTFDKNFNLEKVSNTNKDEKKN